LTAILEENRLQILHTWAAAIAPDPILSVNEWADEHRILDSKVSASPGPYRTSKTPYFREVMECLSVTSPIQEVVIIKGAQVGATEIANNFIGYIIHHAPGPAMFVQPTDTLIKRTSKHRIATMISSTPELSSRVRPARMKDSGNTILVKEFPGGVLVLAGANSAVGLRSMPARYLILDELDGYPMDVDQEGDPVHLAIRRAATFGRKKKILKISTPKLAGSSRIQAAYEETDQCIYLVPCPLCDYYAPIVWRNLRQPGGAPWSSKTPPETVVWYCESCSGEIEERHKTEILERGRWEPTERGKLNARGFKLSALYSPVGWYTWRESVHDFLEAKEQGPTALKVWTNTVLGDVWHEESKTVEWEETLDAREHFPARVPADVVVLTAGVDVQANRLEVGIWGWAKGPEPFAIDHRILSGRPDQDAVWDRLDELLESVTYRHESGLEMPITATAVDAGFETENVYDFCSHRLNKNVWAIVGRSGQGRPAVRPPTEQTVERTGYHVNLYTVGIDGIKRWAYNRLRDAIDAPDQERDDPILPMHIPNIDPFDEEWARQLTAEEELPRSYMGFERKVWKKKIGQKRNEVLDCLVYARAACLILNPIYDALERNIERRATGAEPPRKRRRSKKKPWATGY
jgi:phage terminase large subunit GpA-like protein